tara:strand:+ start:1835 stop:2377 length:543 start_codon:yes stop_codon:yes gene_type:complete
MSAPPRLRYRIHGLQGQVNALRRALIADLEMIAPSHCVVRTNTSCQSDEYVTQRIGLIPFEQGKGWHKTATLCVQGRPALARDILSEDGGPIPVNGDALIMPLTTTQAIDLTLHFTIHTAAVHARFAKTVAVGMQTLDAVTHEISFETLFHDEEACLAAAIASLRARLLAARGRLETTTA